MNSAIAQPPAPVVRRRGRPSQYGDRSLVVLDAASRTLNEDGITNASLDAVARKLGLDKSSLYYYFRNKEDLVFQCYLRAAQQRVRIAAEATEQGRTGRERVETYIRLRINRLNDPVPQLAFLSDLAILTEDHRREILRLASEHIHAVQLILEGGAADGTLAPQDAHLARLAIVGALDWTNIWWRPGKGSLDLADVAAGYIDVFLHGLSPEGATPTAWPEPAVIPAVAPEVHDVFSRDFQVRLKREALFKAASLFFNRHGFDNSTIDQVVEHLGVSKGALYHYVKTKEDLLYGCYSRSLDMIQGVLEMIAEEPGDGMSRLLRYIVSTLDLHGGAAGPLANFARLKSLTEPHRQIVGDRSERLQRICAGFIEAGMADGSTRAVDVRLTRLALLGVLNSVPGWYVAGGANTPREIAQGFCALFANGLAPRASTRA